MRISLTSSEIKRRLYTKLVELETCRLNISQERQHLKEVKTRLRREKAAQAILQDVAKDIQNLAHKRIAGLVSKCLASVFDNPYQFKISFVKRRNKTEAVMELTRNGRTLGPDDSTGGGVVDVVSFALRLACLALKVPLRRKVLILDEPFKFVSVEYRPRVRKMLEMLSKEMGVQIVMSSHQKALRTGKIYEV